MKSLATQVLDRLLRVVCGAPTEDPRRVKPTIVRQRPTDQVLADATTKRHATMNPPPPARPPEPVAAQVSEVHGETMGAPVDTASERIADSGPESPKAPATPPPVRTMAFGIIDSLLIVVIGRKPPDDESWSAFLALVAQQGADAIRILYVTEGPQPTTEQRHELEDILDGRMVPACVVTDRAWVRTTTITLSLGRVLALTVAETRLALAHLDVPLRRRPLALDMIKAKRVEVARSAASAPEPPR